MGFVGLVRTATGTPLLRTTYTGEQVVAPIRQRTTIRKLPTGGATTLQQLYGPEYVKKGFGFTPLDLLSPAINLAAGVVPGGQTALALLGGGGMNGGFDQVGLGGGFALGGSGACPPGTYCKGVPIQTPIGSTCIGSCVPYSSATLPGGPQILPPGIGPIYGGNGQVGVPRLGKKRKRMNYANQKALRRALRRATGYARQQKAVRKAAQEFAREFGPKRSRPRRDLGRGHTHVR